MTIAELRTRLRLPVIAAPMFLVSGPVLVVAACRAGVVGAFPAPNARTIDDLDMWCSQVGAGAAVQGAPWAINVVCHRTYDRLDLELEVILQHRPEIVITALGSPSRVAEQVHAYGGLVLADVTSPLLAEKAVASGADGLVLVCAGAGGHTGAYSPFAFVREVRRWWDGPLVMSGAVSDGQTIRAAELLGADLVYVGTRFLASRESLISDDYKLMVVDAQLSDIVLSSEITGVAANWLSPSLIAARGRRSSQSGSAATLDFSGNIATDRKAWKEVWSAGQGVAAVERIATVQEIVDELADGYGALC